MELKDVILSTLAEMEDTPEKKEPKPVEIKEIKVEKVEVKEEIKTPEVVVNVVNTDETIDDEDVVDDETPVESELIYLNSIRERLLVLFEGFQAPNNSNIEAKIDITLNYLEYILATTESRIQLLKGNKNERI